ncbi:hypothetical protein EWB00_008883, partial [Schistosoma japonicum]
MTTTTSTPTAVEYNNHKSNLTLLPSDIHNKFALLGTYIKNHTAHVTSQFGHYNKDDCMEYDN